MKKVNYGIDTPSIMPNLIFFETFPVVVGFTLP